MNFYPDGLTPAQLQVLQMIAPFAAERQFYLGGGTALAIILRHRRSLDLDWFTPERFADPMAFAQALRDVGILFSTDQTAPGTLHGQVEGVRISFLEFRYPLLSPLALWQETGAYLAHRLAVAGRADPIFQPEAVAEIYAVTRGIPLEINQLSDLSLFVACGANAKAVDVGHVLSVVEEWKGVRSIHG